MLSLSFTFDTRFFSMSRKQHLSSTTPFKPITDYISSVCDRMFVSNSDGPKNGSFTAPVIENNNEHHSRQCIYTFIASENERVQVTFGSFNLRGAHPEYVTSSFSLLYFLCLIQEHFFTLLVFLPKGYHHLSLFLEEVLLYDF